MINNRNQLYYDYIVDRNKEKEKKWKQFRNQTTKAKFDKKKLKQNV